MRVGNFLDRQVDPSFICARAPLRHAGWSSSALAVLCVLLKHLLFFSSLKSSLTVSISALGPDLSAAVSEFSFFIVQARGYLSWLRLNFLALRLSESNDETR